MDTMPKPPVAARRPVERVLHGDRFVDDYAWLKDTTRSDADVLAYLEAENAYTVTATAHTERLQHTLFEEIRSRILETDTTAPVPHDDWIYYERIEQGWQYWIECRKHGSPDAPEEIVLDTNALAEGHDQFDLGRAVVSPDHSLLAYSYETDGSERFTLRIKDLATGEHFPEEIPNNEYSLVWGTDGRTLYYTTRDDAHRPYRVWRHVLGTDPSADELLFEELDPAFYVGVSATRSRRFVLISAHTMVTTEIWYADASDPAASFTVIAPRRQGIEYDVEHQGDRFVIRTNEDAKNFRLFEAPVDDPRRENWREIMPHRPAVKIDAVNAFRDHLVISERERAVPRLRVIRVGDGDDHIIQMPEDVYDAWVGAAPMYDTTTLRFVYTSLTTPSSWFDYDMDERTRVLVKQQHVPGYDPSQFKTERVWARAPDGVEVPVSIVYRDDFVRDGSRPMLLYAYGSYGHSLEVYFSAVRLCLLERGFAFALAHIRGGGELGEEWRDGGKLMQKRNTFTDFIACAEHLIAERYTSADRLAIRGGSAGGLLMGAVANMRPDLFHAVVAEVPFVDVINTVLDDKLLFSVLEYEEWGNPNDEDAYRYISTYSPYENVTAQAYPNILAVGGLNDPRVNYWEPAKWVARLRTCNTADSKILLKTKMQSGHAGASGRYDAWRDEAFVLAFVIDSVARDD